MQPKRDNQPTFFDLAVQQRGSANLVLETIAREVDSRRRKSAWRQLTAKAVGQLAASASYCGS